MFLKDIAHQYGLGAEDPVTIPHCYNLTEIIVVVENIVTVFIY